MATNNTKITNEIEEDCDELYEELEELYDEYISSYDEPKKNEKKFNKLVKFLTKHKKYIHDFFLQMAETEIVSEELFHKVMSLGLDLTKIYKHHDGYDDTCILFCAGEHQFDTLKTIFEKYGFPLPTAENLSSTNNIIDSLIHGNRENINYEIFEFIETTLKNHPLIISPKAMKVFEERYLDDEDLPTELREQYNKTLPLMQKFKENVQVRNY